ncbi:MAG: hypothetical protein KDC61_02185 [Saprospiraceae bacterium]|nr:hypothetical protein [Saprospiraceae bacterium]
MSDFKLKFILRQHTPLIHFQHDQAGATLRATEVKPKLDRFLTGKLGEQAVKDWRIGEHKALNYKIRFINGRYLSGIPLGTKPKTDRDGRTKYFTDPEMYPQVLANMGGKDSAQELKHFRMYETVEVEIFSFQEDLIDAVGKVIPAFFATHNFGNRQSKGFGSFYLDTQDALYVDPAAVLLTEYPRLVYWEMEDNLPVDDIFSDIDILYRLMKSGFNFPDHPMKVTDRGRKAPDFENKQDFATYQPSFLKNYFIRRYHIGSEKRAIKESLFRPGSRIAKDPDLKENNYIRAILGTAEFFEYRDKDRHGVVKIESDAVERFQSAVTFKVFGDKIFLLPGEWKEISNKSFVFSTDRDRTRVQTPNKDKVNFDLAGFLVEFATHFNDMKDDEVARLDDVIADVGRRRNTPRLIKDYLNCLENVEMKTLQTKTNV